MNALSNSFSRWSTCAYCGLVELFCTQITACFHPLFLSSFSLFLTDNTFVFRCTLDNPYKKFFSVTMDYLEELGAMSGEGCTFVTSRTLSRLYFRYFPFEF